MSMKKSISILAVILAVICCICIFTACNGDQKYTTGTHFAGDCRNKGYTRYLLPNGEYYDVPDEDFVEHSYTAHTETEATCTRQGKAKYTCSVCGDNYTQNTPKSEHKAGVYTPDGNAHKIMCKFGCGTEIGTRSEEHTAAPRYLYRKRLREA